MKKSVMIIFLVSILLVLPLVQAQTYSGFNRFTDNVKLAFSGGDNKVRLALEIREKEVDSAINNIQNQEEDKAIKNLERARKKLQIVQEKISLDTSKEIKTSVDEITNKINEEENLPDGFDEYILEEEKTQLTAELIEKTFEYCKELAEEDFALMLKEEECNPDNVPPGFEKELEKLRDLQEKSFVKLMLEIRSCIDDPGTCNCEANVDVKQKAKCEKMVALAVKCEYKEDETSCEQLEAMSPTPGDSFARSFIPDFLMNLFRKKHKMIEYDIQHSDGVPEECWDNNDKPECEKYKHLKENNLDWDEYGNYKPILTPGKHPSTGGTEEPMPTIQESVPECFDEDGNFLEEKCGKITVIWTEDGLVNYIVEKQIDDIINDFENKSAQHTYASGTTANGSTGYAPGTTANESSGQMQVQTKAREIKQEMNQISKQIKDRTYAPGTGPNGNGSIDMDANGSIDIDGNGNGGNNVIDNDVAPGPQGIVGDQGYSDDEGHQGDIPDDTSGASGEIDED